jgi:hypothetical protein
MENVKSAAHMDRQVTTTEAHEKNQNMVVENVRLVARVVTPEICRGNT